jgi:DNA repair protein RadD
VTFQLREYQTKCVEAIYRFLRERGDNPAAVLPTGAGKSLAIAQICRDSVKEWNGRVIVLAHVKELLEQSYSHLMKADPTLPVGIYSAGLGARETGYPVTVAGIQSAYRNVRDFPPADLIIVDEAHRIPPDGEGMYRTFLSEMKAKNPNVRLIGFTATPYRTSTGAICGPDNLLNAICFEVGIRELITAGYLSPLVTRGASYETDFSGVAIKRGEFDQAQLELLMNEDARVAAAISEIIGRTKDRRKILIFCSGVNHAKKVADWMREQIGSVGEIYGETDADERAATVKAFRDGDLRCLVNVEVLTLGFDAPNVDCVALMRATMSAGLYYQMVGRGFRIAEGKKDCLILDFGGNVVRHGPVDVLAPTGDAGGDGDGEAPAKKCPECCLIVPAAVSVCPECGFEFPPREPKIEDTPYQGDVLAPEECDVLDVAYAPHTGKSSCVPSLKVSYCISTIGIWVSEWVCLQHTGYAREKASGWWQRRAATPAPRTVEEALTRVHELAKPVSIRIAHEGKFRKVTHYKFVKDAVKEEVPF